MKKMMRQVTSRVAHAMLGSLRRLGIEAWPIRDRALRFVGLKLVWRDDDAGCIRGTVYEHRISDIDVRFFVTNENDWLQQDHVVGRWYELEELELVRRCYRGGTFVDVGAGLGNHSLFAGLVLNAPKIIAFEPAPSTYRICMLNVLLNDLAGRTTLHPFGLSDHDGAASIVSIRERNIGATALQPDPSGPLLLRRGESLLAGEKVGFIKIDVEGMEMKVLHGLAQVIARERPPLLLELSHSNANALQRWLESVGYQVAAEVKRSENSNLLLMPGCAGSN